MNSSNNKINIKTDLNPSADNDKVIRDALLEFNERQIGKSDHYSVFAFNDKNGIIGGALVYTETHSIYIDILWVKESERGQNIGQQLLLAAEKEGIKRGIKHSTLDTFGFQAEGFYTKNGYFRIGVIKDYIEGYDYVFLRKKLNSDL